MVEMYIFAAKTPVAPFSLDPHDFSEDTEDPLCFSPSRFRSPPLLSSLILSSPSLFALAIPTTVGLAIRLLFLTVVLSPLPPCLLAPRAVSK